MKSPNILLLIVAAFAMTFGLSTSSVQGGAGGTCASDITDDGQIDGADLAQLLADWGQCPAVVPPWATLLEGAPDPTVVTDANLRAAIVASGLPWRVRDTGTGLEMLLVPAGTFTMGCSPGDAECGSDESPAHQVTLTNAFYMGKTEVTQAQWQATMGSNPSYWVAGNGFPGSFDRPVEGVSWNMIQGFNTATGLRLPTEAEWEYACRAATTTARYGVLNDIAWYIGNSGNTTHAVATKLPNALGLYDTIGNVWEWCQDRFEYEPYSLGSVTNPTGPATGSVRLLRGGSWGNTSVGCRGSARTSGNPHFVNFNIGFRAVRLAGTCASDITGDRQINGADLAQLLADWGQCPAVVPAWATLLEAAPNPAVVTDANLRAAIVASGFAWRIRDNSSDIEMLLVPAGTFTMGCSPGDADCRADESPAHQVTLTNAFYMGKTEVTQAQWQATMGSNPSFFVAGNGYPGSFDRPVERVSWNMIQGFNTANGLRLPTEAEWEYACRAATTTASYGVLNDIAWYNGNAGGTTHAVATKLPNALGLYDTLGNVSEWCQDFYEPYSLGSVTNPTGPATGWSRLLRGGHWLSGFGNCRGSQRDTIYPDYAGYVFGFRAVRAP